jgi:hypothetical protein
MAPGSEDLSESQWRDVRLNIEDERQEGGVL